MPFRWKRSESSASAFRRIVREQIGRAVADLESHPENFHRAVHQARRRLKRIRAILRLVRPALGETYTVENRRFRDIARRLAPLRETGAMAETVETLGLTVAAKKEPGPAVLGAQPSRHPVSSESPAVIAACIQALNEADRDVRVWKLVGDDFDLFAKGFRDTYRRGRRWAKKCEDNPETGNLHEWRKYVKYHLHQIQVLKNCRPEYMRSRARSLDDLAELLGEEHDLYILKQRIVAQCREDSPDPAEIRKIDRRRHRRRQKALALGRRLYKRKPADFTRRVQKWCHRWRRGDT